jgi:CHASE2 domain-containing sensor protein
MSSKVFLSLGQGNLNEGFSQVTARLESSGQLVAQQQGSLPNNIELQNLQRQWQFYYAAYYDHYSGDLRENDTPHDSSIEIEHTGVTGFSVTNFQETRHKLQQEMCKWLDSSSFESINRHLRSKLNVNEDIVVIIETADDTIHRLPWHCWSFIADFSQAEVAFSLATYQQQHYQSHRTRPRVLAIFGDRTGIDTNTDAQLIHQLPADIISLTEPNLAELSHRLNESQGWDVLFFAGHGSNDTSDSIQLSPKESLTLVDLSHALKSAIERGLQLAIFNSCSGLGLATNLSALNIPTVIVMREAIPNRVAQHFLQTFLDSFAGGNSLLTAVRDARQQLQVIEKDFPCATWLPVVFCNPTIEFPTWRSFYHQVQSRLKLWQVAAITLITTVGIWGIRGQGYLESIELGAYDLVMNTRLFAEDLDSRLLIVGINENDFRRLGKNEPVRDRVLAEVLQKLQQHQPQAIGLDIYRDQVFGEGHGDLLKLLQQQSSPIISSCLMPGEDPKSYPGAAAPTGVQPEQVGFTNFSTDRGAIVRRQILGMAAVNKGCNTDHALSLRLALKYLKIPEAQETDNGNISIGKRELVMLKNSVAAYRSTEAQDNLRGFQIMLNYRHTKNIARQVSLDDVLSDRVDRAAIAGKIVLIGYVAPSAGDFSQTASYDGKYTKGTSEMPGVIIHAHMVSNILSHVLDGRPWITTWPDAIEIGWIYLWGAMGSLISWQIRGYWTWIAGTIALVILVITYGVYFNAWLAWIPLIPAGLSLIVAPLLTKGWELSQQP